MVSEYLVERFWIFDLLLPASLVGKFEEVLIAKGFDYVISEFLLGGFLAIKFLYEHHLSPSISSLSYPVHGHNTISQMGLYLEF